MLTRLRACILAGAICGLTAGASHAQADPLDLAQYRGKVVYLDFWASWCIPCRQSFPWMSDVSQAFSQRGLVVVAVNLDKDRAAADKFLRSHPPAFGIVYDPTAALAKKYDIKAMPTSILIGRDGKMIAVHPGFHEDDESAYSHQIEQALGDAPGATTQR